MLKNNNNIFQERRHSIFISCRIHLSCLMWIMLLEMWFTTALSESWPKHLQPCWHFISTSVQLTCINNWVQVPPASSRLKRNLNNWYSRSGPCNRVSSWLSFSLIICRVWIFKLPAPYRWYAGELLEHCLCSERLHSQTEVPWKSFPKKIRLSPDWWCSDTTAKGIFWFIKPSTDLTSK